MHSQIDTGRPYSGSGRAPGFRLTTVDNDVIKLERFYKDKGYLEVRVSRELQFTPDFQLADVIFHIHEGQKHRVQRRSASGPRLLINQETVGEVRKPK